MRILYLSPRQCWPTAGGAKLRDYYLARALGESGDLSYVYFSQPSGALTADQLPFCRQLIGVPKPKPYTPGKLLKGLLGRDPLSIVNYSSSDMAGALTRISKDSTFDLVHVDSVHMMQYVPLLGDSAQRVVFSWHNIESELLLRYAANTGSVPRRAYATMTARRLAGLEMDMLRSGFGHLVCSERERAQLLERMPGARIAVIDNGVDGAQFGQPRTPPYRRIVFVGLMSYHANAEAATWFAQAVWPALHERFPDWILTLVGADPPASLRALGALPGVEVTGTVPDVRPYYREALMAVVPLKTGAGTRLKILEAMAAGVPVVSTALGAEGLAVTPNENIVLAETESEWLEACSKLAVEQDTRQRFSDSARQLVAARYDWRVIGRKLVETYREWLATS